MKIVINDSLLMNNGLTIPKVALGTWCIDDDKVAEVVRMAIAADYRHIDTAQGYENERGVGEGIKTCGVPRDQIFITSKVKAEKKSYKEAAESINETLKKLDMDYVDMMIIHCPQPWAEYNKNEYRYEKENLEVWKALEEAVDAGKIKTIGLSNFRISDVDNIMEHGRIKPAVNQILTHISNTPLELIDYCKDAGIVLEAYSPIAHGRILGNEYITNMANKYGVSLPQLCIRYTLQLGMITLPKATSEAHIRANAMLDFEISDEDMELLKYYQIN